MSKLYGEEMRQFDSLIGWEDGLLPTVNETFHPQHNFTKLMPNLTGCDPDDSFSRIPYEKGSAFLLYIEQQLGDVSRFNEFLRSYIAHFAYKSIETKDWKQYLYQFFADQKQVLDSIDYDQWLCSPGIPPNKPRYEECLVNECRKLADRWLHGDTNLQEMKEEFSQMSSAQKMKVLDCILAGEPLPVERVEQLEETYSLNSIGNYEIRLSWILLAIKAKWTPIIERALEFVSEQGRIKYVKPVYRKLFAWDKSRNKALETFERNKPFMHPITVHIVKTVIN